MPLDLSDDGFETVRLLNPDGSELFATQIDLWEVHNRLVDLQNQHAGKPAWQFHQALVDYLKERGFPEVSHRFAARLAAGISQKVVELKNVPPREPSPDSRASTTPASSV